MLRAMGASVVAMVLMLVIGPAFIRWLRVNEFGQNIREEGPEGHKTKEGTPTMGGMLIWFAVLIPYLIFSRFSVASLTVLIAALGNAVIGFADDWIKIVRKRSLGLSARYKLLLQLVLSLFIGFIALHFVGLDTAVDVPFTSYQLELGAIGFYALIFLTLAGFSNAVNLTDGLDGLAAGASAIVLVALAGIAFIIGRNTSDPGITDLMVVAGCVGGACLGFLWYNTFPADVFMGDTGSLGLGGAIAGMAVITRTELVLLIIGGLFVVEAASVMAQVISFKLFQRRVLLMAPLHHHFELKAWSETKIIVRFWIVAAIFAGAGFAVYYATFRGEARGARRRPLPGRARPAPQRPAGGAAGPPPAAGGARRRPRRGSRARRRPSRSSGPPASRCCSAPAARAAGRRRPARQEPRRARRERRRAGGARDAASRSGARSSSPRASCPTRWSASPAPTARRRPRS